jgi:hypothetical protein
MLSSLPSSINATSWKRLHGQAETITAQAITKTIVRSTKVRIRLVRALFMGNIPVAQSFQSFQLYHIMQCNAQRSIVSIDVGERPKLEQGTVFICELLLG